MTYFLKLFSAILNLLPTCVFGQQEIPKLDDVEIRRQAVVRQIDYRAPSRGLKNADLDTLSLAVRVQFKAALGFNEREITELFSDDRESKKQKRFLDVVAKMYRDGDFWEIRSFQNSLKVSTLLIKRGALPPNDFGIDAVLAGRGRPELTRNGRYREIAKELATVLVSREGYRNERSLLPELKKTLEMALASNVHSASTVTDAIFRMTGKDEILPAVEMLLEEAEKLETLEGRSGRTKAGLIAGCMRQLAMNAKGDLTMKLFYRLSEAHKKITADTTKETRYWYIYQNSMIHLGANITDSNYDEFCKAVFENKKVTPGSRMNEMIMEVGKVIGESNLRDLALRMYKETEIEMKANAGKSTMYLPRAMVAVDKKGDLTKKLVEQMMKHLDSAETTNAQLWVLYGLFSFHDKLNEQQQKRCGQASFEAIQKTKKPNSVLSAVSSTRKFHRFMTTEQIEKTIASIKDAKKRGGRHFGQMPGSNTKLNWVSGPFAPLKKELDARKKAKK